MGDFDKSRAEYKSTKEGVVHNDWIDLGINRYVLVKVSVEKGEIYPYSWWFNSPDELTAFMENDLWDDEASRWPNEPCLCCSFVGGTSPEGVFEGRLSPDSLQFNNIDPDAEAGKTDWLDVSRLTYKEAVRLTAYYKRKLCSDKEEAAF